MDYFKALIYKEISDRITTNGAYFTNPAGNNTKAPAEVQYYTNQYSDQPGNLPFKRPAVLIEFGEADISGGSGLSKKAKLPVIIHVVQDVFNKGRDKQPTAQKADFEALLNYPYLVNDLLDNWRGTCFNKLVLVKAEPDHDTDNLLVEKLEYTCEVTVRKGENIPQ